MTNGETISREQLQAEASAIPQQIRTLDQERSIASAEALKAGGRAASQGVSAEYQRRISGLQERQQAIQSILSQLSAGGQITRTEAERFIGESVEIGQRGTERSERQARGSEARQIRTLESQLQGRVLTIEQEAVAERRLFELRKGRGEVEKFQEFRSGRLEVSQRERELQPRITQTKFDPRMIETREVPGVTLEPRPIGFSIPPGEAGGGTLFAVRFTPDLTIPDLTRHGTVSDLVPDFKVDTLQGVSPENFIVPPRITTGEPTGPTIDVIPDVTRQATISPDIPQLESPQVFDISKGPTITQRLRQASFIEEAKGQQTFIGVAGGITAGAVSSIVGGVRGTKQLIVQPVETIGRGLEAITIKLPETTARIGTVIRTEPAFATGFLAGEVAQFKAIGLAGRGVRVGFLKTKSFKPRLNRMLRTTFRSKGKTITPLSKTFIEEGRVFAFGKGDVLGRQIKIIKPSRVTLRGLEQTRLRQIGLTGLEKRTAIAIKPGDFLKQLTARTKPTQLKLISSNVPGVRRLALERLRISKRLGRTEAISRELRISSALEKTGRKIAFKVKPSRLGLATFERGQRITKAKQLGLGITDDLLSRIRLEKAISKAGVRRVTFKPKVLKVKARPTPEVLKRFDVVKKPTFTFDVDTSVLRNQLSRLKSGADVVSVEKGIIKARPSPTPGVLRALDTPSRVTRVASVPSIRRLALERFKKVKTPKIVVTKTPTPKKVLTAKDIFKETKLPKGVIVDKQGIVQVLEKPIVKKPILRAGVVEPIQKATVDLRTIPPTRLILESQFAKVPTKKFGGIISPKEQQKQRVRISQRSIQIPKTSQIGLIKPKTISAQLQVQPQRQLFKQKQPQRQLVKQISITKQVPKFAQSQLVKQRQRMKPKQITRLVKKSGGFRLPSLTKPKKLPRQPTGRFQVFGRRFGKFKLIGVSKTERGAILRGKRFARQSLGATFKVPKSKRLKVTGFRTKVTKKGILFIEPRGKRLKRGTREIPEIQLFKREKARRKTKKKMKGGRKK